MRSSRNYALLFHQTRVSYCYMYLIHESCQIQTLNSLFTAATIHEHLYFFLSVNFKWLKNRSLCAKRQNRTQVSCFTHSRQDLIFSIYCNGNTLLLFTSGKHLHQTCVAHRMKHRLNLLSFLALQCDIGHVTVVSFY